MPSRTIPPWPKLPLRWDSSRGKAIQAGLYPNPTIGYASDQVGAAGTLGETQGAFVQQTIVTAGKLRLSRAKYNQEAYEAEIRVIQQQYRILNGVRSAYFELLALNRMIDLHRRILANAEESLLTHKEMLNTGQANRADVLLAQVAVNDAKIELRGLENRYTAHWQQLTALVGSPDLPVTPLKGQLEPEGAPLQWSSSLERLFLESPELLAARAHVVHDQISLQPAKKSSPFPIFNSRLSQATTLKRETPQQGYRSASRSRCGIGIRARSIKFRQIWGVHRPKSDGSNYFCASAWPRHSTIIRLRSRAARFIANRACLKSRKRTNYSWKCTSSGGEPPGLR